ncbi:SDR family oxidoreductase [Brevibacterium sp. K11IcPPYGO002]|uniref:SDR family oxidoreductase n=1 Tax=Brevibacterium sp. K11IcPPYGO002 TaxID=3058837 RepID=UPI003D81AE3C
MRIGLPHVRDGGSITLTTGVTARAAIPTGSAAAMASGAVESFVMAAAGEMPRGIRINVASPTVLESATHFHDFFPGFPPASDEAVGNLYRRAVESIDNGTTYVLD